MIVYHPFRHYRPALFRGGRYRARLDDVFEAATAWALRNGYRIEPTYGVVTQDGKAFAAL